MKKSSMDLAVGASILIALCILIVGVLWLKESFTTQKQVAYTAVFTNVGALQTGDPIMVNGVTKGRVGSIYLRNSRVAVVLRVDRDVALSDSSRVVVQNIGLMGERGIGIQLFQTGTALKPTHASDTTFLAGTFETGIGETMGMMGTVLAEMENLVSELSSTFRGTIGDTSFITLFHTLSRRLDTLTAEANDLLARNGPTIDRSVRNLADASTQLKTVVEENGQRVSAIMANGDTLTADAITLVRRIDSLSATAQGIVQEIRNGRGAIGMAVTDEQFSKELKKTVENLDSLANQIRKHGLKVKVRL